MNTRNKMILVFLVLSLLLCACAAAPAAQSTEPELEATEAAPVVPEETQVPGAMQAAEAVMPSGDVATGTLLFYLGDKTIHAGGPMSDVLELNCYTEQDFDQMLQPGHISGVIRIRIILDDVSSDDEPMLFLVAINTAQEPQKLSDCLIYSITANTDSGISFGSGNEAEAFATGETTRNQIIEAYGEPTYANHGDPTYEEIAYYQPFNCAYFSFKNDVLRQVVTYYSANVYGDLAADFEGELGSHYYGADCRILMSQYLDVTPYQTESTVVGEKLDALEETIILGGQTIELGVKCVDMPDPFGAPFKDLLMPLGHNCYIRTGIGNDEEFFLINKTGDSVKIADYLTVKGVITENCSYINWGNDRSAFHEFQYGSLTQNATIEQILEAFGTPRQIHFSSSGRVCYAWLFYEDAAGNTLQMRVDPITNQLIELRLNKYFSGERPDV